MLKRLLTFAICAMLALALAAPVGAVKKEKSDKKAKLTQVDTKKKVGDAKKKTSTTPAAKAKVKKAPVKGRYDTFVDKNNNGIDDRKEQLKQKKDPAKTKTETTKKKENKK